jgi:hypothetical protein
MHRVAFEQIDNTSGEPTGRLWSIVSVDSCSARLEFTEDYRQTLRKDSYCSSNNNPVIVQDSSCWCLVGVAESFVELNPLHAGPNGAQLTRFPTDIDLPVISHCPQVDFDRNVLNLQGINLLYSVWCGDIGPLLPLNGAAVDGCSLNLLLPNKQLLIEHFRAKQQHHDEDSLNSALVSKDQICSLPIWFALLCPSQGPIAVYTGQKIDLPI